MGEETVRVDPNEDLDTLIARLKQSRSKDVVLVMPQKTRALQTLDNFYALRKAARDEGMNLTFDGGNKTMKGLAKLLGFQVRGGDGGDDDIADFAGNTTSQMSMSPAQTQPQMSARPPTAFDGPPTGFMVQPSEMPPARNGSGRNEPMPPPLSRTPDDFFNEIPDMSIPSIQPPPMHNDNGFGNGNDQVLTRNNVDNFFGGMDNSATPPPAPRTPEPAFDFGGGSSPEGGRTMSYEEAMKTGLFGGGATNLSEGFQFDTPADPQPTMSMSNFDDDDMGVPPVGADNAAAKFRGGGARRGDDLDDPVIQGRGGRPARSKAPRQPRNGRGGGVAVPAGLAALGTRVNKILNPVERTSGGGMMKADISPVERERRRKQSQSTTFIAVIAVSVLAIAIILGILFSFGVFNGTNNDTITPNPIATIRVNLTYKTTPVSNTVSLLLDPGNTGGTNATQGQTNPATVGNGAGTGGRLPVTQISAADVQAKADYPAFGSKQQPTGTAQGNVTISNGTNQAVGYGAGAQLYKAPNGVTYRLRDGITVPAGNVFAGVVGRASGVVVADRAGSVGNLPSGFSFYLNNSVAVQAGAIAGGSEQQVKVVSPADQEALKKQLVEKAKADALASMKNQYNPATQDMQIATGEPSCQFSKNPGDIADSFTGTCSVKPIAYVYSKDAFQKAVQEQLVSGPNQKIDLASMSIGNNGQLKTENNRLIYQTPVSASSYTPVDLAKFRDAIANKTRAEAQDIITRDYPSIASFVTTADKLPEAGKIEVVTTPSDAVVATATPAAGSGSPAPGATGGPATSATPKP